MSPIAYWIHTPLAQALGRTLAHFVWEGALLAAVLMALRDAVPARRRYALACVILAAMPIAFVTTFVAIWMRRPVAVTIPVHWTLMQASSAPIQAFTPRFTWSAVLPWVVPVWFAGVLFFYARGLAGWAAVQRLRHRGVCSPPSEWQQRLNQLGARLRISRPVMLLESCLTDTPVLVGYLRPVILLPLGCLTGLSTAQVECILLHELAHVARHDYLVNLLQSVVEGLLFYHPAVWWASHVVRTERENCCDDRVVEVVGNARAYAATLAILEQRRALAPALAANDGNLMKRIRRLTADTGNAPVSAAPAISAGLLLVMVVAAVAAVPAKPRIVRPAPLAIAVQEPLPTPYQRWLDEDVVYIVTAEERAAFQSLRSDKEREQFLESFWLRRGGRAFREEHYRRIAYANEHFGSGDTSGWKTDSGRNYIMNGRQEKQADYGEWLRRDVAYISSDKERAAFQQLATDDERYRFIEQFWVKRGGQAAREEHYRRIAFAGERFRTANKAGWETDMGRVYILNGQPDTVNTAARPYVAWSYLKSHATFIFREDTNQLVSSSDAKQEDAKVSIIMGGKVIGPGDVLDIAYRPPAESPFDRAAADKRAECAELEKKYQPGFPPLAECLAMLTDLMGGPAKHLAQLRADQSDIQSKLKSRFAQQPQSTSELHQQRVAVLDLETKLSQIKTEELQIEATLFPRSKSPGIETHRAVNRDGTIYLDGLRPLIAAGLAPAQLETAIGPGATVRVDGSAAQLVTVVVPLGSTRDQFHVVAEVTTNQKIVQSFEEEGAAQQSLAKTLSLRPGTYHLTVAVKNMTTNVPKTSALDFAVE